MRQVSMEELYQKGEQLQGEKALLWRDIMSKHPTTSFEEWREVCVLQGELFAGFLRCRRGKTAVDSLLKIIAYCERKSGNDFSKAQKVISSRKGKRFMNEVIEEAEQDKQCHFHFKGFTCYCT